MGLELERGHGPKPALCAQSGKAPGIALIYKSPVMRDTGAARNGIDGQ
jgi:hypothetical protein